LLLRLIEVPLVGGFRLPDRRLVLVHQRLVLSSATHVPEHGANGGEDRRGNRDAASERIPVLRLVLDLVIVRPVDVKAFRHGRIPLE